MNFHFVQKLSPRSYPIQFERKKNTSFLSVVAKVIEREFMHWQNYISFSFQIDLNFGVQFEGPLSPSIPYSAAMFGEFEGRLSTG